MGWGGGGGRHRTANNTATALHNNRTRYKPTQVTRKTLTEAAAALGGEPRRTQSWGPAETGDDEVVKSNYYTGFLLL